MFMILGGKQKAPRQRWVTPPTQVSPCDRSKCSDEELFTLNGFGAMPQKMRFRLLFNCYKYITLFNASFHLL